MNRTNSIVSIAVLALCMAMACANSAAAQVVIDMPAPKSKPRQVVVIPPSPPSSAPPIVVLAVEPGDMALDRYSRARYTPYDTYSYGDRYRGIRQYGYPFQIWWGGFGFHGFHCGNRFTGFVGRH